MLWILIFLQLEIGYRFIPEKDTFLKGEPVILEIIFKNNSNDTLWAVKPYLHHNFFLLFSYYLNGQKVERDVPKHFIQAMIDWPVLVEGYIESFNQQDIKEWKGWASLTIPPKSSKSLYIPISARTNKWGSDYILSFPESAREPGTNLIKVNFEKIKYRPRFDRWKVPDFVYIEPQTVNVNKTIWIKLPEGKTREVFKKWMEARKYRYMVAPPGSGYKQTAISIYSELINGFCPDTHPYYPTILREYLAINNKNFTQEEKRKYIKKYLLTYKRNPYLIYLDLRDKKWVEKNVLVFGKSFVDSLPEEVKNRIEKIMEGKK